MISKHQKRGGKMTSNNQNRIWLRKGYIEHVVIDGVGINVNCKKNENGRYDFIVYDDNHTHWGSAMSVEEARAAAEDIAETKFEGHFISFKDRCGGSMFAPKEGENKNE